MKKKNTFLTVALLLAVVVLGVGYAASTGPWVVEGTATATASEFDVAFTNHQAGNNVTSSSVEGDLLAKMAVELENVGDTATATFTITNRSQKGIGAEINEDDIVITRGTNSEYFDVTYKLGSSTIASNGGTTTLEVTVELIKATTEEKTETFTVSLNDIQPTVEAAG